MDTEMQSPTGSISPASPVNTFSSLVLPYSSMSGHGYDNGHAKASNIHPALQMGETGEDESHIIPWRPETSNFSYHSGSHLHDLLKSSSWWLDPSTVHMIIDELNFADVNSPNGLGETPMRLVFNGFQAPIHPAQLDVLLRLIQSPRFSMRYHPRNSYSPLGFTMERALDSRHILAKNEDMANTLCNCLCRLLDLEANPDILVRGQSIAHHMFQDPDNLMSYTALWPFLETLTQNTTPTITDVFGNTVLHCALTSRNAGHSADASALARQRSAITTLLERSAALRALEARNARRRTALQLLVDHWRADGEFWRMARDFVGSGADAQDLVPRRFAADLHELAGSRGGVRADDLGRCVAGDVPLSVVVWLSACGQRTHEAWREHLWALEACADCAGDVPFLESLLRGSRS